MLMLKKNASHLIFVIFFRGVYYQLISRVWQSKTLISFFFFLRVRLTVPVGFLYVHVDAMFGTSLELSCVGGVAGRLIQPIFGVGTVFRGFSGLLPPSDAPAALADEDRVH